MTLTEPNNIISKSEVSKILNCKGIGRIVCVGRPKVTSDHALVLLNDI